MLAIPKRNPRILFTLQTKPAIKEMGFRVGLASGDIGSGRSTWPSDMSSLFLIDFTVNILYVWHFRSSRDQLLINALSAIRLHNEGKGRGRGAGERGTALTQHNERNGSKERA